MLEKCKCSGEISLPTYHFSKMQVIFNNTERELTQEALRSVYGSPCGNGTTAFPPVYEGVMTSALL
jgi:hypothetical protein